MDTASDMAVVDYSMDAAQMVETDVANFVGKDMVQVFV